MTTSDLHARAVQAFEQGRPADAAALLAEALGQAETPELWNDWASVQVALGAPAEARAGLERALELEPGLAQAAFNLGALLSADGQPRRAAPLLRGALAGLGPEDRALADQLLAEHAAAPAAPDLAAVLEAWAPPEGAGRAYFEVHRERYAATLELLPPARSGARLLELGASFHHMTPAFAALGYQVRGADCWVGEPRRETTLAPPPGQAPLTVEVDNFDLEKGTWPYPDASFDAVAFCEVLEHLAVDPARVLGEINRVLRPGGLLLLTTPNLACAKAVEALLAGESPYVYGQFVPQGIPSDRHVREYTASEVARLLGTAGFEPVRLSTRNSWWKDRNQVLAKLVAGGHAIALRGDDVLALSRKAGPVKERWPEEFYCSSGVHSEIREGAAAPRPQRVLVIHELLPHHDRSGSDLRMLQVLQALRAGGHEVTYLARNGADRERYEPDLAALGIEVHAHDAPRLRALGIEAPDAWRLDDVLRNGRFDVAILFHWFWTGISVSEQYIPELRRASPGTRVVVLTDDRHGLRELRGAELSGLLADAERGHDFTARELECYRAADLVAAITEDDRRGLLELAPELRIELLPMTAEAPGGRSGFSTRRDFVFLGNFENLANQDAVRWLCDEVWPRIHAALPEARLHLAGHKAPTELAERPGVVVVGHVPDVGEALEAFRVFLSPIRFGTGIKTKNLAALGHGLPMVTTTVGAEGMSLADGEHAFVTDDAGGFAARAVELHQDQARWEEMAAAGLRHVRSAFSTARLEAAANALVAAASALPARPLAQLRPFSVFEADAPGDARRGQAVVRPRARLQAWVELGERLLEAGDHAGALRNLRHLFYWARGDGQGDLLRARALHFMALAYRGLGEEDAASRCDAAATTCARPADPRLLEACRQALRGAPGEDRAISVIVPTYQRRATLARCLQALAAQSLPPDQFEVVVVDDGSTDGTSEWLATLQTTYRLVRLTQRNQGVGAARRAAVAAARGRYLLLANDDTLAHPDLLQTHLAFQRLHHDRAYASLGDFGYVEGFERRPLTWFLGTSPFLFPQRAMAPDTPYGGAKFVTCNLAVRRDLVLAAGSFDPAFRLAEDSELGYRLSRVGVQVFFLPAAIAWHDHLELTVPELLRRARAYGGVHRRLLKKHPALKVSQLGLELQGPIKAAQVARIRARLDELRPQASKVAPLLEQLDRQPLGPLGAPGDADREAAEKILAVFEKTLPLAYWFAVMEGVAEGTG